jgi:hypothetical protein
VKSPTVAVSLKITAAPAPGAHPSKTSRRRKLKFEFAALNFSAPENLHFRYQLENVDDDWVDPNQPVEINGDAAILLRFR